MCLRSFFIIFFNIFWLSWFSFKLNRIFQVHDMTINFSFSFIHSSFPFSHSRGLSISGNDVCHRWPSRLRHHFSCDNCFKRVVFWLKGCSCHFYPKKRLWIKSIPEKWVILINVSWGINQGNFRASRSWDLCFWSLKRFGFWLEAVTSFDACQITNYQFSSKTHHFLLPDFQKIREKVFKSRI